MEIKELFARAELTQNVYALRIMDHVVEIFGSVDRFYEICAAEREGRLIVLPCRVGDEVWLLLPEYTVCSTHGERYSESVCAGCMDCCDSRMAKAIKRIRNVGLISIVGWIASECFGKTVFLSEPAARAAMEKEDPDAKAD